MIKIDNLTYEELENEVIKIGEPKFKAKQIFDWLHNKTVKSFDDMTNISKKTKEKLAEHCSITEMSIKAKLSSKIDGTKKYIMELDDGNIIESVFLKYNYGNTACISSQVGCKMGCVFCASTKNGMKRSLTTAEMLNQIYLMQLDTNERISNVVIMGSGEPLENYDNVLGFLNIINDERGQNISLRKITLSTCGIVPNIYRLADEMLPITLAISLHAPTQEKRETILPISRKYKLDELMKACNYYLEKNNRRLTFEYILIDGVNDSDEDAINLCNLLKGTLCNINLIPYNKIKESHISSSNNNNVNKFKKILIDKGLNATVRRELGSDINAACGQLRNEYLQE